jgi:hypothetical protein
MLTWALYTKTPRECLYYMELGCMVVSVGVGMFTATSTYCVMLDMDANNIPENFTRDWVITGLGSIFLGWLCISGLPKRAGKALLKCMPGLGGSEGGDVRSHAVRCDAFRVTDRLVVCAVRTPVSRCHHRHHDRCRLWIPQE